MGWGERFRRFWFGESSTGEDETPETQPSIPPPPQPPSSPRRAGGMEWEPLDDWNRTKAGLWFNSTADNPDLLNDKQAQRYFEMAYLDRSVGSEMRKQYRDDFHRLMADRYDIDFNVIFDWDAWREAYGDLAI